MKLYKLPFYGLAYRLLMRTAHYFDWHYAPVIGPLIPSIGEDVPYQRWCKWCGLRQTFYKSFPSFKGDKNGIKI